MYCYKLTFITRWNISCFLVAGTLGQELTAMGKYCGSLATVPINWLRRSSASSPVGATFSNLQTTFFPSSNTQTSRISNDLQVITPCSFAKKKKSSNKDIIMLRKYLKFKYNLTTIRTYYVDVPTASFRRHICVIIKHFIKRN